jgi:hypothetical protein
MKKLVKNFGEFSLWKITELSELQQVDQFILHVYYYHHLKESFYPQQELQDMIKDDIRALPNSSFFVLIDDEEEIVGTIKSELWDNKKKLPIEKDFKVDLNRFIQGLSHQPQKVFHIGRFAIDQDIINKKIALRKKRLTILKLLMYYALLPVMENSSNIFICECDQKLFSKLNLLGLYPHVVGNSKLCMGSYTVPIYCDNEGIKDFFIQHKQIEYV